MAGTDNMHGEEIVTKKQCLECAANRKQNCGYSYSLLRFLFRSQPDRSGVHVTDLTGCLRRSYYSKTEEVIKYPHESLTLALGSITHAFIEGNDDVIETEEPLKNMGIEGTTDVIEHNGRPFGPVHVQDLKTTRWLKPSNLPYGNHASQVNMYAALLRDQGIEVGSASIQYVDLSGPTKCRNCKVTVVPADDGELECPVCENRPNNAHLGAVEFDVILTDPGSVEGIIDERRDELNMSLEMKDPPEGETSFLCSYCDWATEEKCPVGYNYLQGLQRSRR
jgi:CRISPR/Cas system-associated exonuclease Cas4 (RecB family)